MLLFVWGDLWTAGTLCGRSPHHSPSLSRASVSVSVPVCVCVNVPSVAGSDNGTGLGLDCLNDMESMSCHLQSQAEEQRCAGYTLTFPYGSG